ncbi:MAG: hypothetical protein GC160_14225 [Acidobacteria bacterium]|nr:hypothetical protein [Acidobacteriota bacterium]
MTLRLFATLAVAVAVAAAQGPPAVDSTHYIRPGENPQAVMDAAAPGDKLVFLPGVHEHPLRKHQSLLYVDKPIDIELMEGAVLKLADGQTTLETEPELSIDHGSVKTIDDFSVRGRYDKGLGPVIFTVRIDGEGKAGRPDTFSWVTGWGPGATTGTPHAKVPVTGDWQPLSNGVEIKFDARSGHSDGSFWALSYDGRESYGIRVGYGTQPEYIENVRIFGRGVVDLNQDNNVQPSELVKDISACVLLHGRVRNVSVEQITMTNTMRTVMVYGEHTGKFLRGGATAGGESFDAENIAILGTRTINPKGRAYLLGHPSHRGLLSKVRCNYNYMETGATALEPNFNLSQYEVIGNVIKSGGRAIHCWRKSVNGIIKNNVRIDDPTGMEVVMVNAPGAWETPENLIIRDNRNHLSDPLGYWATTTGGFENKALGQYSGVAGGRRNVAEADFATVTGGDGNRAAAPYSQAQGWQANARLPGEDALASGAFETPGDAQSSTLVAKGVTTDGAAAMLALAGGAPVRIADGATVAYRVLAVARGQGGGAMAAYEAKGLAVRDGTGLKLLGAKATALHESDAALDFEIVDAGQGALGLRAHGLAGRTLRWVARLELVEVAY